MKPGDKVHTLFAGRNGIVKSVHPGAEAIWVVFHCAGDWKNYYKYTGTLTLTEGLREGWIEPIEPDTKFSYN